MAIIHFLNVKQGDCTCIQHNDRKVTVIDVCNAFKEDMQYEKSLSRLLSASTLGTLPEPKNNLGLLSLLGRPENHDALGLSNLYNGLGQPTLGPLGLYRTSGRLGLLEKPRANYNQKESPVNPMAYLKKHNINSVFRFILTHPDMDHMDGIKDFFEEFEPINFWDIDNDKEIDSFKSQKSVDDWEFYKKLRDGRIKKKRLTLHDGAKGKYYNEDEQGKSGGNGLHILSPSKELVRVAKESDDYNDCSYVILYRTGNYKILFAGDSHDKTWEYILCNYENNVKNIDLLIAPHHGRDSDRSYDFLDVLKPTLTFFGNAKSEHLAHSEWNNKKLEKITNNQGNCLIAKIGKSMDIFVTHKDFAEDYTHNDTYFDNEVLGWHIKTL